MGVGAGLYMCDVVKKKFTFAISSPDEFLCLFVFVFVCLYGYGFLSGGKDKGVKFCMRVRLLSRQVFSHFGGQRSKVKVTRDKKRA